MKNYLVIYGIGHTEYKDVIRDINNSKSCSKVKLVYIQSDYCNFRILSVIHMVTTKRVSIECTQKAMRREKVRIWFQFCHLLTTQP